MNYWPLVYVLVMGVLGALCAYWYRHAPWAGLAVRLLTGGVFAATLALHVLTRWILQVDPGRDIGRIPLPSPLPEVTVALLIGFFAPGLLWQGILLGSLARPGKGVVSIAWKTSYVLAVGYSLCVLPWAVGIIMD